LLSAPEVRLQEAVDDLEHRESAKRLTPERVPRILGAELVCPPCTAWYGSALHNSEPR